jgi:hypothetical protein
MANTVPKWSGHAYRRNSDRKSPHQSLRGSRISICHVSAGDAWAGIEVQVATLLRALSNVPKLAFMRSYSATADSLTNCTASESPYMWSVNSRRVSRG